MSDYRGLPDSTGVGLYRLHYTYFDFSRFYPAHQQVLHDRLDLNTASKLGYFVYFD